MSPVQIELLLKCYYLADPVFPVQSDAHTSAIRDLLDGGLIKSTGKSFGYMATDRGRAYVAALCNVPLPVKTEVWVVEAKTTEVRAA